MNIFESEAYYVFASFTFRITYPDFRYGIMGSEMA